jgi:hypothetical protein
LISDLVTQIDWRRFGEGRLAIAPDSRSATFKVLSDPVEEDVPAWFRDVEQADGQSVEALGPRDALTLGWGRLRRRIE